MNRRERFVLENHGYLLAEAAIRRHADFLATKPMPPPHCEWMEPARVRSALADSAEQKEPFGRL